MAKLSDMSTKHTPGPWTIGRSADNTPAVCVPCPNSSGFVVAHINRLPKLGLVKGDVDANARLIAAAPEMLEALLHVQRILEGSALESLYSARERRLATLNIVNTAIAKAEGR